MYLRRNRRKKGGADYEYWTLVESVRTARGPRQRVVACIGKAPGLDKAERAGWEQVAKLLDGEDSVDGQGELFEPANAGPPQWAPVDVSAVRVERVRQFGQVYLALALWRRLGLHAFVQRKAPAGREQVDWASVAAILSVYRTPGDRSPILRRQGLTLDTLLSLRLASLNLPHRVAKLAGLKF